MAEYRHNNEIYYIVDIEIFTLKYELNRQIKRQYMANILENIFIKIIKEDTSIYMTPYLCDYLEDISSTRIKKYVNLIIKY